jgi:dolichol-phosphate mannosyltransferase
LLPAASASSQIRAPRVCVIIPCYKVKAHILEVLARIPSLVSGVFVVDDACPEGSGELVRITINDPRVSVLTHAVNQGVGGAMVTGYQAAIAAKFDIAVKVDGDGQMDPAFIPTLIRPIVQERADYTKGTRFFSADTLNEMPVVRLLGNIALSFISKFTSGYWSLMDPTNGYTAIHVKVLRLLPLPIVEKRFFFESDMLYHCGILRAMVVDVPMFARYGNEVSNLRIGRVLMEFPSRFMARIIKRFLYQYVLRDFNVGSISVLLGAPLALFGLVFGAIKWWGSIQSGVATPAGTVMLAALPLLLGIQLLISSVLFDISNQPKFVLHPTLPDPE